MASPDGLFDQLAPAWRQSGTPEVLCPGLAVSRFGAGGGRFKVQKLDVVGDDNRIFVAADSNVQITRLVLRGKGHTLFIGGGCNLRGLMIRMVHDDALIAFGNRITTGGLTMVAGEGRRIVVGDDCLFSHGIWVRNTDMHSIYRLSDGQRINEAADVTIGRHVWIGQDVKISKGATIGADSVIGTNALVSGDVPPNCVAAGIPAKVLQQGVRWDGRIALKGKPAASDDDDLD